MPSYKPCQGCTLSASADLSGCSDNSEASRCNVSCTLVTRAPSRLFAVPRARPSRSVALARRSRVHCRRSVDPA
eukprot:3057243-Alexandrium_andersonii.AAC.1